MRIRHYEVEGVLAQGGMGVVYRATDTRSGARVVLKLLKVDSPQSRRRLAREAEAMRRLVHPSVVTLYDAGEHEGSPYLVLPYVEGESLQERLDREGPRPVEEALQVGLQVGEGLRAAHALGLLHRDVKPANVLVDGRHEGSVKLTDFGLVKDVGPDRSQTVSLSVRGRFLGTPGYWPREQAYGALEAVGPPADVYALGALLYALLSGRPPRAADTLVAAIRAFDEPVPPLDPRVPGWLRALIAACLENEPSARPSLGAVLEALEARAFGGGDARPRAKSGPRLAPAALAGLAALVALGLGWGVVAALRPVPEEAAAPEPEVASPEPPALRERRERVAAMVEAGRADARAGRNAAAIERYDEALALDPGCADAYAGRGASKATLGSSAEAIADFDAALALDPNHADACLDRSIVNAALGRYPEAIADCTRALALNPAEARAYLNRAVCNAELGLLPEALADFDAALELDPRNAQARINRGLCCAHMRHFEEAIRDYDEAIALDPGNAWAFHNRGASKAELGRQAEALEDYDWALGLDPRNAATYLNRASCRDALGRHAEALEDFDKALELGLPSARAGYATRARARAAAKLEAGPRPR